MDFRADEGFQKCLYELCDKWHHPNKVDYAYWKHITKNLIRNHGVMKPIDMVLACMEDISDKEFVYEFHEEEKTEKKDKPMNPKGVIVKSNPYSRYLYENVKISDIAKKYGIKVKKNKCICPFHNDSDPSMSLNDKLNVFYCFGCHTKGNILTFVNKMEEKINGKKRS